VNSKKQLFVTIDFRHYQEHWDQKDVYKAEFGIGIQQHED